MKRVLGWMPLAGLMLIGAGLLQAQEQTDPNEAQDVVFLGEKRPVFLRLQVRHGSTSAFAGYEGFLSRLFMFLDRDQSGALNRSEAKQIPSSQQLTQFFTGNPYLNRGFARPGRMPPSNPHVNIEELDTDKDGSVSLDELKAYYATKGVGPLVVENLTAPNPTAPSDDLLFTRIDCNRDGKLSREELQAAVATLIQLDQDDDEMLTLSELGMTRYDPFRAMQPPLRMPPAGTGPQPPEPKFGLELIPRGDRRLSAKMNAARKIVTQYDTDKDGKLTASEIGWQAAMLAKWDRNRDGKLDSLELGRWLSGPPESEHLIQLSISPGASTDPGQRLRPKPGSDTLRLGSDTLRLGSDTLRLGSDTLRLGNVQLTVVTQPLTATQAFDFKGQLLSQFRLLDSQRQGYLTRRQLEPESAAALRGLLEFADRNNDSRLSRDELTEYLDLVASAVSAQVSIRLASSGQGLFGLLDRNGDGFLSVRELREAWTHLAAFAPEKADALERQELPYQVRLIVGRGGNSQTFEPILPLNPTRPVPTRGPLWFRKMDSNGDGDISAREWLGDQAQFALLDSDQDGLISLAEALAYEAARQK